MLAIVWQQWLAAELHAGQITQMEGIFERCLLRCPQLELWQLYIQYIRQKESSAEDMLNAIGMLLGAVGSDPASGPLWVELIALTRGSADPAMAQPTESITATRHAYQRALTMPVAGIEGVWKEYEDWEGRVAPHSAKVTLAELYESALNARRVGKERLVLYEAARSSALGSAGLPSGLPRLGQLGAWRGLWTYEATNPQRLEPRTLHARMKFTFEQALIALWRSPQAAHQFRPVAAYHYALHAF